jgi:hypothetical protein
MYRDDPDFSKDYEACENLINKDRIPWLHYMLQEVLLFKGNQLCIPKCYMRENILQENHNGGLVGHFGQDTTYDQLSSFYCWLGMRTDVKKFVERCRICQHTKGKSQNACLHQPL